ncbi:MAG: ABC transporter permease [Bacteroidetes bacterium]|nr:ABC transporter permease [Bacteroidota bacterium]
MKILYNIKWSFKQFRKHPLQAFINVFGLAIGLTVFMLISLYIYYQKSFDQFHGNAERIYRIENGFGGITPATYLDYYKEKVPELKYSARISALNGLIHYQPVNKSVIKKGINATITTADKDFFKMFNYPLVSGNLDDIYENPASIILTKSLANKLFSENNPLNKIVTYDTENRLVVKGIIEDIPENSSLRFDAVIPIDYYKTLHNDPDYFNNWGRWMYETFFLFEEGTDISMMKEKLDNLLTEYHNNSQNAEKDYKADLTLKRYDKIYLMKQMDRHIHGNKSHFIIFSVIAVFVLLIACINYVNISTALASSRFKSLGIQKVVGALRKDIISLILTEGIVTAFLSVVLSVLITEFVLPYFRDLTFIAIQIPYSPILIISVFIVLPLMLGILAGLYPSFYLSAFKLTQVVKGEITKGKSGATFRKVLTILQFAISVFLIIGTITVNKQLNYINKFDPGFETQQIGYTVLNSSLKKHFDAFKGELIQNPNVLGVTRSNNFMTSAGSWMTIHDGKDNSISCYYFGVDEDFFDFFEIDFIHGRNFTSNDLLRNPRPFIINRKLADWYGSVDTSLTKLIYESKIVGVVDNIQITNLYSEPGPVAFKVQPENSYFLYIKMKSDNYKEIINDISDVWLKYAPEYPFELNFLDDHFEEQYASEIQFGKVFMIFAIISIFLACLGLFALASFMLLKRTKEIGVRKALGSSTRAIVLLLTKELVLWVIISNIIAVPLAYFFMNKWLNSFVYKTSISWWIFVIAILTSLIISLLTILYQTLTTARKNPVESLRYE